MVLHLSSALVRLQLENFVRFGTLCKKDFGILDQMRWTPPRWSEAGASNKLEEAEGEWPDHPGKETVSRELITVFPDLLGMCREG